MAPIPEELPEDYLPGVHAMFLMEHIRNEESVMEPEKDSGHVMGALCNDHSSTGTYSHRFFFPLGEMPRVNLKEEAEQVPCP